MPWPESDEALVELARSDPEAFGELYERNVKRVYNYLYYRTGARPDAEDLTARTFMQALSHLPKYRQYGVPFSAWLLRIAHNLVANWFRDKKKNVVPLDAVGEIHQGRAGDPGEAVEEKEKRQELLEAVAALPEERRQLILLRFVEGMRAADIAVVMGRSEGAVKALLHRTMEGLRKNIGSQGHNGQRLRNLPIVRR
jgi:RNA polymerase sigma-70 factor, ECF subfamily